MGSTGDANREEALWIDGKILLRRIFPFGCCMSLTLTPVVEIDGREQVQSPTDDKPPNPTASNVSNSDAEAMTTNLHCYLDRSISSPRLAPIANYFSPRVTPFAIADPFKMNSGPGPPPFRIHSQLSPQETSCF